MSNLIDRRCKLTPAQRAELIQRRKAGVMLKVLAYDYGVSMTHVKRLCGPIYPAFSAAMRQRA